MYRYYRIIILSIFLAITLISCSKTPSTYDLITEQFKLRNWNSVIAIADGQINTTKKPADYYNFKMKALANKAIEAGHWNRSEIENCAQKAIEFQPAYANTIPASLKDIAINALATRQTKLSADLIKIASLFNRDIGNTYANELVIKTKSLENIDATLLYCQTALRYSIQHNKAVAQIYKNIYDNSLNDLGILAKAIELDSTYAPQFDQAFREWCNNKSLSGRRSMHKKYASLITPAIGKKLAPPPKLQKMAEFEFTGKGKNDQGENKVTCGVNYNSNDILIFVGESNKIDVMVNTEFLNKESSKTTLKLPASHKKGYSIRHRAEKDFPYSVQVWRMI